MRDEALLLASEHGFSAEQVHFSSKLEWANRDGKLELSATRTDRKTLTIFLDAFEARYSKPKERLDALAHILKHSPGGHEHDQSSHGNWSDGPSSVEFVSPSVADHMDFAEAVSALASNQQFTLKSAAKYIDEALNLKGAPQDVVGAWADGAENSVANFHTGTKWADWNKLVASAAMKGHLADQKQVLVFQEKPERKARESVHLEGSGGDKWLGKINVDVEVNPSRNELRDLVEEYKMVRILVDRDGNLYAWNADKAIHDQIAGAFDLTDAHKDVWFFYEGRIVSDRYLSGDTVEERFKTGVAEVREKLASLEGNGALMSFEAKGDLSDIHKSLLDDGLAFHSLVPKDGGATVYAAVEKKKDVEPTIAAMKKAAERYGSEVKIRPGRAEFIGDQLGTGPDREQRDRARAAYEAHIRRSNVPGSDAVWQSVRDRWGKVASKSVSRALGDGIWDEDEHPRDENGRFTFSGNDSNDGPGGDSGEGFGGGLVMPEDEAPSEKPKGKVKVKPEDFAKDKVELNGAQASFIDRWNEHIATTPADFVENFLGRAKGVNTKLHVSSNGGRWVIKGDLLGPSGDVAGNYTRVVDIDRKTAESDYFRLTRTATKHGIGKQVLAGNIETYKKLGIEKVKVHANIDVGGYAWAKYGYVPTSDSWASLRSQILRQLGDRSSRVTSTSTYTPESWEELSDDQQNDIMQRWMADSRSEFLDSEINNWRENGEDLHIAKQELVSDFDNYPSWATEAIADWRKDAELDESFPFTDKQILDAIELTYDDDDYEGREDPEVEFDDKKLAAIIVDPAQLELPYLGEGNPADVLTSDMRDDITKALVDAFNVTADQNRNDVEPPDYLAENIDDTMEEYWDSYDERERFRIAERNGWLPEIEIENEDEEEPEPVDVPEDENAVLRRLAQSSNPKSLWAIADSPRGKELLLNSDWYGVLNLKDKESMDRFNAYVGRKK